jgi:glycogen debranching enzyme
VAGDTVSILDGNEFVVSDRRGDLNATPTENHGLFLDDTRFLSKWLLTVNGRRPALLSIDDLAYFRVQHFMALSSGDVYVDSHLSIIRKRAVGHGFHEDITLVNHAKDAMELEVRLEAGSDFADLFEVKDHLEKKGEFYRRVEGKSLVLGYIRGDFRRETRITPSAQCDVSEDGLVFKIHLPAHGRWSTCIDVLAVRNVGYHERDHVKYDHDEGEPRPELDKSLADWMSEAPKLHCSWTPLEQTYRRSLIDLAALRFQTRVAPGALPAAGLPWRYLAATASSRAYRRSRLCPISPRRRCAHWGSFKAAMTTRSAIKSRERSCMSCV